MKDSISAITKHLRFTAIWTEQQNTRHFVNKNKIKQQHKTSNKTSNKIKARLNSKITTKTNVTARN